MNSIRTINLENLGVRIFLNFEAAWSEEKAFSLNFILSVEIRVNSQFLNFYLSSLFQIKIFERKTQKSPISFFYQNLMNGKNFVNKHLLFSMIF